MMRMKSTLQYTVLIFVALFFSTQAQARSGAMLPDFAELVEQSSPAVVNVSTTQRVTRNRGRHGMPPELRIPGMEGSPWNDLFRHFFGEEGPPGEEEFRSESLGSGFIIDADGYIMTNYHVVRDATEIVVRLSDRREFVAEVVGHDERTDIALLKIDARGLPTTHIGSSQQLRVGEWVLAIGSPFGFEHSVSVGVVSAIGRSLPRETYVPFIQTDVAINPGNSGGPLFNQRGEVVGVNAQIFSRSGGFMGLSFAIPIDVAMDTAQQLRESGRVSRGWLGVMIQDVTRELAESFGMRHPHGALVSQVMEGSPAAAAGVRVGDVIVEFNGREVTHSSELPPLVGSVRAGSRVQMKVIRDGRTRTLRVVIAELPEDDKRAQAKPEEASPERDTTDRIGLAVSDLNAQQRQRLGVPSGGVQIVRIAPGGAAANAGLNAGDVLLRINQAEIESADHFARLVRDLPAGRTVPVLVRRGEGASFIPLRVPE